MNQINCKLKITRTKLTVISKCRDPNCVFAYIYFSENLITHGLLYVSYILFILLLLLLFFIEGVHIYFLWNHVLKQNLSLYVFYKLIKSLGNVKIKFLRFYNFNLDLLFWMIIQFYLYFKTMINWKFYLYSHIIIN